jgi:hypothetical protein
MKNLLLLILTVFTLTSCSKDDKPTNPIDQLPPATQTGANTAGCLVDGQAFLPKGYSALGNLTCVYQDGLNFSLSITENKNNILKDIGVFSLNQKLEVGQTYQLTEYNTKYGSYIIYYPDLSENKYLTTTLINGELKITNHNFNKAILSGTFWFDAINSEGKIVKIREGRFDMQY